MPTGGRDFLRLMNDQSRRAADFERRMRWSWMRRELTDDTPPGVEARASAAAPEAVTIDLRTSEEPAEPPRSE